MSRLSVLILVPSLALAPSRARGEIIERVVAKVNGQIITLSEFQARQIAAAQAAHVDPASVGTFLRQNNARILQDAIDGIRKDNNITTDEQFQDALNREGLTLPELRKNLENGILRRYIVDRDVRPKIEATDAELQAEYQKLRATEFTKAATVTLQEILVKDEAGGMALARDLVARAKAGEDFAALAKAYSAAPSRAHGGDIGQLSQGELNPELEKIAFALPVGGVSDPQSFEGGYRILKVVAKTSGSTTPFETAKDKVRERLMMSRFEAAYDAYMQELRKNAVVELRVREVPLQLTGPIPEGSLLEALEPLAPGAPPVPPVAGAGEVPAGQSPTARKPAAPPAADEEIVTTPQAAPEKVAPPPPPSAPKPDEAPPPRP